jgi:hypothetical protein
VAGWIIGIYAAIMLALMAVSGCIALFMNQSDRRRDAYRVFRLLIVSGAASGGLLSLLIRLHGLGLLRW